jgi:hypothetical protein
MTLLLHTHDIYLIIEPVYCIALAFANSYDLLALVLK